MDLDQAIEAHRGAMDAMSRGDSGPTKALYSDADDVTLANPWGLPVTGRKAVTEMLDFVGTRFRDGTMRDVDRLGSFIGSDLATTLEIENWQAKVSGRDELSTFSVRVTSVYRREDDGWRLVHRHADPIATAHPDGPLRGDA